MLPDMVNFVIQNYYPDIWAAHGGEGVELRPEVEAQNAERRVGDNAQNVRTI